MGRPKEFDVFLLDVGKTFIEKINENTTINIKSEETLKVINSSFKNLFLDFGIDLTDEAKSTIPSCFKKQKFKELNNFTKLQLNLLKKMTEGFTSDKWANIILGILHKRGLTNNYAFYYEHIINYFLDFTSTNQEGIIENLKMNRYIQKTKTGMGHITKLKEDKHLISVKDLDEIFDKSTDLEKVLMGLLITTGMRSKGFLNIDKKNIDYENYTIKTIEKGNKETLYFITPTLLKKMKETSFLDYNWTRSNFYSAIKNLGLYIKNTDLIHPHAFRHTFASLLVKNGNPINEVSKLLNHSSEKITIKYYVIENVSDVAKRSALPFFNNTAKIQNNIPKIWTWLRSEDL